MAVIIRLPRKPRPLRKTYDPAAPYEVVREDEDDGSITFIVSDSRPGSFRDVCNLSDDEGRNPYAKHDAEQVARALNLMVALGKETLPKVTDRDRDDLETGWDEEGNDPND